MPKQSEMIKRLAAIGAHTRLAAIAEEMKALRTTFPDLRPLRMSAPHAAPSYDITPITRRKLSHPNTAKAAKAIKVASTPRKAKHWTQNKRHPMYQKMLIRLRKMARANARARRAAHA